MDLSTDEVPKTKKSPVFSKKQVPQTDVWSAPGSGKKLVGPLGNDTIMVTMPEDQPSVPGSNPVPPPPGSAGAGTTGGHRPAPPPVQTTRLPGWAIALIVLGGLFLAIVIMVILAAIVLPALAAAKRKAESVNHSNKALVNNYYSKNLKEIGLAFHVWEGEHNGQFPFNVSQAQGGVKEVCRTDASGFEENPAAVFMVMSNELTTPRFLVCPNDRAKHPAADFAHLTTNNISYELRTGPDVNDSHPQAVLVVDPVNGLVLHCDGTVQRDLHYKQ